jgi:predicted O-methyltransferase YrrM
METKVLGDAPVSNIVDSVRDALRPLRRQVDIQICKRKIKRLPADMSLEQIVDFALSDRAIRIQQVPSEIMELARLVDDLKPRTIVEIGTSRGGSLFIWSRLAPAGTKIISIDMPGSGWGEAYTAQHVELFKLFPANGQKLHVLTADSHALETRAQVEALLGGTPIDLLFIDGDHSYEGVKKDFELFYPLVAPSGMIAFHDIAESTRFPDCKAKIYWDEIKQKFQHREIIADRNQGYCGIGVLWNGAR